MTGPSPAPLAAKAGPRALAAALAAAAALAVFFAPALATSRQFLSRDAGRLHAPVKRHLSERLGRGELPEWNPYDGLGAPVIASAVDAPQHPFNLLLVALPFELGFKAWVLLSYIAAALGGFLWASALGRLFAAALGAGIAFSLSGVLVSTSDNLTYLTAFATLPWIFASAHHWMERGGAGRLALVGLASGCAAAAGDPQSWGVAVLLLPLYATWVADRARLGVGAALRRGLVALAVCLVAAAPFVLPVVLWLPHSSRAGPLEALDQERYALAPLRLAELFFLPHLTRGDPGFTSSEVYRAYTGDEFGIPWYVSVYAGTTVAALAVLGAARDRRARRLLLAAAFLAWTALGSHAGFEQLARHLPLLSGFRFWEKMTVWPTLLMALAAASGIDRLLPGGATARRFAAATGAAAAVALSLRLAAALWPQAIAGMVRLGQTPQAAAGFAANLEDGLLGAGLPLAALAAAAILCARGSGARWAPAVVALVVFLDLSAGNVPAYAHSPAVLARSAGAIADRLASEPGLQRVVTPFQLVERPSPRFPDLQPAEVAWMWGGRMLYPAFNVARRVGNLEPSTPLAPGRIARFLRRKPVHRLVPAAGMWGAGWTVVPDDPGAVASLNLRPPIGVAASDPSLPAVLLRVPHRPRAYLAGDLASADRHASMEFALDDRSSPTGRSVVEAPVPADYRPPDGEVRIVQDDPERIELLVRCDRPGLVVLNDAYAAGWSAAVDGRPAGILATNYLARGVWVEAGRHEVSFRYRTPGLREGWGIASAGALALGAASLRRRRIGADR